MDAEPAGTGARGPERRDLHPARALVLGFAGAILAGGVLLSTPWAVEPGRSVSFLDALFTATSAVTVTGLVVVPTGATWSLFGELVILALIQAGGLGIATMSILFAVLLGKRIGLRERLLLQEALHHGTLAGLVRLLRWVAGVTLAVEAAGAVALAVRWAAEHPPGEALYLGIFHSVAAFNNSGFDLFGDSLVRYAADPAVNLTMMALIVVGGIGFGVIGDLREALRRRGGNGHRLSLHTRLVLWTNAALWGLGFLAVLALEGSNPATLGGRPLPERLLAAAFHAVTPRTAGFNTLDVGAFLPATLALTMALMFIGASPGSTGGGIKTTTAAAIWLAVRATFRGRQDIEAFERRLSRDAADRAMVVAITAFALVAAGITVLALTERQPFLDLAFEAFSAFGTVGLSTGITPELSPAGRVTLMVLMFAGRLGPLTLGFALARRQLQPLRLRYPEEKIMIG